MRLVGKRRSRKCFITCNKNYKEKKYRLICNMQKKKKNLSILLPYCFALTVTNSTFSFLLLADTNRIPRHVSPCIVWRAWVVLPFWLHWHSSNWAWSTRRPLRWSESKSEELWNIYKLHTNIHYLYLLQQTTRRDQCQAAVLLGEIQAEGAAKAQKWPQKFMFCAIDFQNHMYIPTRWKVFIFSTKNQKKKNKS